MRQKSFESECHQNQLESEDDRTPRFAASEVCYVAVKFA